MIELKDENIQLKKSIEKLEMILFELTGKSKLKENEDSKVLQYKSLAKEPQLKLSNRFQFCKPEDEKILLEKTPSR